MTNTNQATDRDDTIPLTILTQLGGNWAMVMIGGTPAAETKGRALLVKWKAAAKGKLTAVQIAYEWDDTYTLTWYRGRGIHLRPVGMPIEGVYAEDLRSIFESTTGLYLSL